MANKRDIRFPFAIAKAGLIFVGLILFAIFALDFAGASRSVFDCMSYLNEVLKYSSIYSDDTLAKLMAAYGIPVLIFGWLIIYSGLIIGFSFAKKKKRSILSIVFSSLCILNVVYEIAVINSLKNIKISIGSFLGLSYDLEFDAMNLGIGVYIFLALAIIVLALSIVDLILLSNYNKEKARFEAYQRELEQKRRLEEQRKREQEKAAENNQRNQSNVTSGIIKCVGGEYANMEFPINNHEELAIGRNSNFCSIVITRENDIISGIHCKVRYNDGHYELLDCSRNGVYIDNKLVAKNVWIYLAPNTAFTLASSHHIFRVS